MTTHVFIVDERTFQYHLQYMFAGTGAGEKDVDFNGKTESTLYYGKKHAAESGLVYMMADCCRVREGDLILFYLQATSTQEGRFYGVFKALGDAFLDRKDNPQFLNTQLGKNLTFRVRIAPDEVYGKGVSEWKALDEIRCISSPCQMLWSLIYRKLKGNRGNTMITIYESERLVDLIRRANDNTPLPNLSSYAYRSGEVVASNDPRQYTGSIEPFNILPRLIQLHNIGRAHEAHLQMYITQHVGRNADLDQALGLTTGSVEWIGNEVSCGVGMQRIDVMISKRISASQRMIIPIELKAVPVYEDCLKQVNRYVDWIEQYYVPNRVSTIQPVLLCKASALTEEIKQAFNAFNIAAHGRHLPLKYVEYSISENDIHFVSRAY